MLERAQRGISRILVAVLLLGSVFLNIAPNSSAAGPFAGGDGTAENPYQIATAEQLDEIRNVVDAGFYYKQTADIDLTDYLGAGGAGFNGGEGWEPIGTLGTPFIGVFDGNGHAITGLKISRPAAQFQALFGHIDLTSEIRNTKLLLVDIEGDLFVGGLAGFNEGTITNSVVEGVIAGVEIIGGLVGYNVGVIRSSSAQITITGDNYLGGLVGDSSGGSITNSTAEGSVTGIEHVGGLAGYISGILTSSIARVDVEGDLNVGGLAGSLYQSTISNSYATGNVRGTTNVGGLVGFSDGFIEVQFGIVTQSYATGDTTGTLNVGGLVGYNIGGTITNAYAAGNVDGDTNVGGLVGNSEGSAADNYGFITNAYAAGIVIGVTDVGGLVGFNDDTTITDSFYDQETSGQLDAGKGTGQSTADMKQMATFLNWVTPSIWHIDLMHNDGYPVLSAAMSYNGNGHNGGSVPIDSHVYRLGENVTISDNTGNLRKSAFMFDGWNTAADGSGTPYTAGQSYLIMADTTLYATWEAASTNATLTSTIGTVSTGGTANEAITDIPSATTLATLKAAITPALLATFDIYEADGTTLATVLASGQKVIVTAQDGITRVTYLLTVIAAATPPSVDNNATQQASGVNLAEYVKISIPVDPNVEELQATIERMLDTQGRLTDIEIPISRIEEGLNRFPEDCSNYAMLNFVFDMRILRSGQIPELYYYDGAKMKWLEVDGGYEVLIDFLENYNKPITLSFAVDLLSLKDGEVPAAFSYDEVKQEWVEIGGGIVIGNLITVQVNPYTEFAVFAVEQASDQRSTNPTNKYPAIRFNDTSGHWAEASIKLAVCLGFVNGYPDGSFKPNRNVTRAELTVMLMKALKLEGVGTAPVFTDSAKIGDWARKWVGRAVREGVIKGYPNGSFRPQAAITRSEMAMMLADVLDQPLDPNAVTGFADDKDIPGWARSAVAALEKLGLLVGRGSGQFVPHAMTTRAEAVTVLLKLLDQKI